MFIPFTLIDAIDIILVALIMFWAYRATKGTNAPYIFAGILILYFGWVVVKALNMELLATILGQIMSVGVIFLIIIFQPEIRRFLQMIGMRQKQFDFVNRIFSSSVNAGNETASLVVSACVDMSHTKTGALIVLKQKDDLQFIVEGGIELDAAVSVSLLENLFFKNAPLHDGAVIIENNRIVAAKCILPVTQSNVPKHYGTRHRAAIGLSEIADSVVVVVSEETGNISVVRRGELIHCPDQKSFTEILRSALQ